jgi:hypothetical protein
MGIGRGSWLSVQVRRIRLDFEGGRKEPKRLQSLVIGSGWQLTVNPVFTELQEPFVRATLVPDFGSNCSSLRGIKFSNEPSHRLEA